MQLAGFIEALSGSASAQESFDLVCQAVASLGYRYIGLFAVTPEALEAAPGEATPIVISNYSESFVRIYLQKKCQLIDPVLPLTRETITPLIWEDVVAWKTLSPEQSELVDQRREAGLQDEITCPIHAPCGQVFALRFARGETGRCELGHLSTLQVISIHFYYTISRLWKSYAQFPHPSPAGLADNARRSIADHCGLSQREQEVLLWTARGKSASSISVILDLSENTVNFYVKNAMRKLGTTNRVVAVVLAVRSGLIQP